MHKLGLHWYSICLMQWRSVTLLFGLNLLSTCHDRNVLFIEVWGISLAGLLVCLLEWLIWQLRIGGLLSSSCGVLIRQRTQFITLRPLTKTQETHTRKNTNITHEDNLIMPRRNLVLVVWIIAVLNSSQIGHVGMVYQSHYVCNYLCSSVMCKGLRLLFILPSKTEQNEHTRFNITPNKV